MSETKAQFKWKKPRFIHFVIALLLALLIMDRGAAWLYGPKPGSKEVVLYTTTWCSYCESLRAYLKSYNIPYIERDVEKSLSGTLGWWALGHGRGVPLSVIGEKVVYGYDLPKIDAALRELGYSIQEPEPEAETATVPDEGNVWPQATTDASVCARAEEFKGFYEKFKADKTFRIQRTRFPLRKRVLSGSHPYRTTDEVVDIEKNQVLTGQELVYLDPEVLEMGGYSERIYGGTEEGQVEVIGPENPEPVTIHRFHNESGCWFFIELTSYEYFGSLMILNSP